MRSDVALGYNELTLTLSVIYNIKSEHNLLEDFSGFANPTFSSV